MKKIRTGIGVPTAITANNQKPKHTDQAPVAKRHQRHLPVARRYSLGRPSKLPSSEIAAQRPRRTMPPNKPISVSTAEESQTQTLAPDKQPSSPPRATSSNRVHASNWTYRLEEARLAREMDRDGCPEPPLSGLYLFGCILTGLVILIILLSVL